MTPRPVRPPQTATHRRAPPREPAPALEFERELAMAWVSLDTVRVPALCERRVVVLRPFALWPAG